MNTRFVAVILAGAGALGFVAFSIGRNPSEKASHSAKPDQQAMAASLATSKPGEASSLQSGDEPLKSSTSFPSSSTIRTTSDRMLQNEPASAGGKGRMDDGYSGGDSAIERYRDNSGPNVKGLAVVRSEEIRSRAAIARLDRQYSGFFEFAQIDSPTREQVMAILAAEAKEVRDLLRQTRVGHQLGAA